MCIRDSTTLAGPDVTLTSTHDGALLTSVAMTGPVAGTISWQHDTAFRVIEERINGAHAATFAFDDDDLLTQAGGLTITRDPASGFVTQASAGLVTGVHAFEPASPWPWSGPVASAILELLL